MQQLMQSFGMSLNDIMDTDFVELTEIMNTSKDDLEQTPEEFLKEMGIEI